MRPELVKKLKWLEAETLALKQASLSGLNSVNFFRLEKTELITFSASSYWLMCRVYFDETIEAEPFTEVWATFSENFYDYPPAAWVAGEHCLEFCWQNRQTNFSINITAVAISAKKPTKIEMQASSTGVWNNG